MSKTCRPNWSRRGKWLAAGLLAGLSLLLSAGSALSQRHQSLLLDSGTTLEPRISIVLPVIGPAAAEPILATVQPLAFHVPIMSTPTPTPTPTPTFTPSATATLIPPSATGGGQPPEPTEQPAGLVQPGQGGWVYCGLEFSAVWLQVPAEFVPDGANPVEFTCDHMSVPGAWQDAGYQVSVDPASVQILLPIQIVFEAGEADSGTEWLGRYRRAQSDSWRDLDTGYSASTGRVQTELPVTLFQGGGGFVVGLFAQPTGTETLTPTPEITVAGTAELPSATPEPPSPTTPPDSTSPTPSTHSPPVPSRTPTATPAAPPPGSGGAGLIFLILGGVLLAGVATFLLLRGRGKAAAPAVAAAELALIQGQAQPPKLPLHQPVIRIGRDPANNDVVVNDVSVSKLHAEIRLYQERYFLYDLQSTNGTFVNEALVTQPQVLSNNDQITIGSARWLYRQT